MIEKYLAEFESCLVGTREEKAEWVAELAAHLQEADEAGELQTTMARLGSPRQAAAAFRSARPLAGTALGRRLAAAFIDAVPLVIVVVASFVQHLVDRGGGSLVFPPFFSVTVTGSGVQWNEIAQPVAQLWLLLGLGAIEARTGRTPGKALMGLRTVSENGTPLTARQAYGRRLSILAGPLVWLDWLFATDWLQTFLVERRIRVVAGGHQRLFDMIFHTIVIADPAPTRRSTATTSATG